MKTSDKQLAKKILNHINQNTNRDNMDDFTTKQVAEHFKISTDMAYKILDNLSGKSGRELITKCEPVNGNDFQCCGWVRNEDPE